MKIQQLNEDISYQNKQNRIIQEENDLKNIISYAEYSMDLIQLSQGIGRNYEYVKKLLFNNPDINKKVQKVLKTNRDNLFKKSSDYKEETIQSTEYFLDTCFVVSLQSLSIIQKMISKNCTIVITNVLLYELHKIKKRKIKDSINANKMLTFISLNMQYFKIKYIDDIFSYQDENILKYCMENIPNVTLLTCDRLLALRAKMYGIPVHFFQKNPIDSTNTEYSSNSSDKQPVDTNISVLSENKCEFKEYPKSLSFIKYEKGNLVFSNFKNKIATRNVISGSITYTKGTHKLKIGDNIYSAEFWHNSNGDFIIFKHYEIISLNKAYYSKLIYSKRIDSYSPEINKTYKTFMNKFKKDHNCKF